MSVLRPHRGSCRRLARRARGGVHSAPPGVPATQTPSPTPLPGAPVTGEPQEPLREPVIPQFQPKPLPPVPSLSRLGVGNETLPLSLNDAIKRALENNNDIEVARDDVRFAETQLRALEGIFDPVFAITPTYDKRISPQQSSLGGGAVTSTTTYSFNPSVQKQFGRGGGNYFLTFANDRTNTSNSFSLLNPFYSSNLSLQFTQPLLRDRSIDKALLGFHRTHDFRMNSTVQLPFGPGRLLLANSGGLLARLIERN